MSKIDAAWLDAARLQAERRYREAVDHADRLWRLVGWELATDAGDRRLFDGLVGCAISATRAQTAALAVLEEISV